jgi:hypothetical protein
LWFVADLNSSEAGFPRISSGGPPRNPKVVLRDSCEFGNNQDVIQSFVESNPSSSFTLQRPGLRTSIPAAIPLCIGIVILAVSLSAEVIVSPVSVTESNLGTYNSTTPLTNMINQSGITTPFTNGVTDFDAYFTPNNKFSRNVDNTKWQSLVSFNLPLVGNLDFDLGELRSISKLAIWNVSVKDVQVVIAEDQAGLDTAAPAGTFILTQNLFSFSMRADLITLPSSVQGRFVRLHILSEYKFSPSDNFAYATIGEVAVWGVGVGRRGPQRLLHPWDERRSSRDLHWNPSVGAQSRRRVSKCAGQSYLPIHHPVVEPRHATVLQSISVECRHSARS